MIAVLLLLGIKGDGVTVAVLDGGIDYDHPDLAGNLDFANSQSFVPGESWAYALPDTWSHATHVAGMIAAADNGFGVIGVAPNAQLVHVKVLNDLGVGSFAWVIQGIYYAADLGFVDIMNLSLGALIPDAEYKGLDRSGAKQFKSAICKAVSYA